MRHNTVSEVYGEGINAHDGSQYTLIEQNTLFGVRAVGIYSDGAPDTTIRRNIVVGTANSAWWRSGSSVGAGIALNNEAYHYPIGGGSQSVSIQSKRAKVYGNLVAYTSTGLAVWGQGLPETSFDGVLIYNNTFVDNNTQVSMNNKPKPGAQFTNNILLSLSSGNEGRRGHEPQRHHRQEQLFQPGRSGRRLCAPRQTACRFEGHQDVGVACGDTKPRSDYLKDFPLWSAALP